MKINKLFFIGSISAHSDKHRKSDGDILQLYLNWLFSLVQCYVKILIQQYFYLIFNNLTVNSIKS